MRRPKAFGREVARSYLDARRTLHSWLEQWELDFHRSGASTEQATLRDLGVLVGEFQRRLTALDETRGTFVSGGSWIPGSGTGEPTALVIAQPGTQQSQATEPGRPDVCVR